MSSRDLALLNDMLEAARMAVSYVHGVAEEQFVLDTEKQDAVIYRILCHRRSRTERVCGDQERGRAQVV